MDSIRWSFRLEGTARFLILSDPAQADHLAQLSVHIISGRPDPTTLLVLIDARRVTLDQVLEQLTSVPPVPGRYRVHERVIRAFIQEHWSGLALLADFSRTELSTLVHGWAPDAAGARSARERYERGEMEGMTIFGQLLSVGVGRIRS